MTSSKRDSLSVRYAAVIGGSTHAAFKRDTREEAAQDVVLLQNAADYLACFNLTGPVELMAVAEDASSIDGEPIHMEIWWEVHIDYKST